MNDTMGDTLRMLIGRVRVLEQALAPDPPGVDEPRGLAGQLRDRLAALEHQQAAFAEELRQGGLRQTTLHEELHALAAEPSLAELRVNVDSLSGQLHTMIRQRDDARRQLRDHDGLMAALLSLRSSWEDQVGRARQAPDPAELDGDALIRKVMADTLDTAASQLREAMAHGSQG